MAKKCGPIRKFFGLCNKPKGDSTVWSHPNDRVDHWNVVVYRGGKIVFRGSGKIKSLRKKIENKGY